MNVGGGSPATPVRVAVRDPRQLIGEAIGGLIEHMSEFVLTEMDPAGGLATPLTPDVVLVGVPSPPDEGLGIALALRQRSPEVHVVLLADALDRQLVGFVLEHHLSGLLLTDCSAADLAACLRQVSKGHAVLPGDWHLLAAPMHGGPLEGLSARQMDVLELLAEGLSYEEIAAKLFISANTVKFHVRGIFVRLGVRNRTAAARFMARSRGPGRTDLGHSG